MKKTTSERLKELLKITGLTQAQVLEKCKNSPLNIDISKSMLSKYVRGDYLPKQDRLLLLAVTFGVSEAWLMGYDVPMERVDVELAPKNVEIVYQEFKKIDIDMLQNFNKLNEHNKNRVIGYVDMLLTNQENENQERENQEKEVINVVKSIS